MIAARVEFDSTLVFIFTSRKKEPRDKKVAVDFFLAT